MGTVYRKKRAGKAYGYYIAKYRTADGLVATQTTECKDRSAAMAKLIEFERREERIRAGIWTEADLHTAAHGIASLSKHLDSFEAHLQAKGASPRYVKERKAQLLRVFEECGWKKLAVLDRGDFERWLNLQKAAGMGAARRNIYQEGLVSFGNWALESGRLRVNPFARMPKANVRADRRHERRAFTEKELVLLLDATRRRPLHDRIHGNRGEGEAALTIETRTELELLGYERALIYRTLALTGLRRGELASITVGACLLDGKRPALFLHAAHEKNRKGAQIPLRVDLATDLRLWLELRLEMSQRDAARRGIPVPMKLPHDAPMLRVPHSPWAKCSTGTWSLRDWPPGTRMTRFKRPTSGAACWMSTPSATPSARIWPRQAYHFGRPRRPCGIATLS